MKERKKRGGARQTETVSKATVPGRRFAFHPLSYRTNERCDLLLSTRASMAACRPSGAVHWRSRKVAQPGKDQGIGGRRTLLLCCRARQTG